MIEKIEILDLIQPDLLIIENNEKQKLKIEVYEDEIIISTKHQSWDIVCESKKDFENVINPDNKLKKYIKRNLKYFFERIAKLF